MRSWRAGGPGGGWRRALFGARGASSSPSRTWGPTFTLVLYSDDEAVASRASRRAFDRIKALDVALTDYDPNQRVDAALRPRRRPARRRQPGPLRRHGPGQGALGAFRGAFDPSIAPVVRLWRRARRERKLPDPELLARARAPGRRAMRSGSTRRPDDRADPARDEARPRRHRQGVRLGRGDRGLEGERGSPRPWSPARATSSSPARRPAGPAGPSPSPPGAEPKGPNPAPARTVILLPRRHLDLGRRRAVRRDRRRPLLPRHRPRPPASA